MRDYLTVVGDSACAVAERRPEPKKMSDALFSMRQEGLRGFVTLPSNSGALDSILLFSSGLLPFVALVGPSGWGKSHLLRGAAHHLHKETGQKLDVYNLKEWIERAPGADSSMPLMLDDAQGIYESARVRQELRKILERRVRGGKPTLLSFSMNKGRSLKLFLPQFRSWTVAPIEAPRAKERTPFVQTVAAHNGLTLSDELTQLLNRKVIRTGGSLLGAIKRLKLMRSDWSSPRATLKACGVLYPLFLDEGGWDMRDHTHETLCPVLRCADKKTREEMCIYVMHHLQGISEEAIGSYFHLSAGQVYSISNRIAARIASGEMADLSQACCENLLTSFATLH